MRIRNAQRREHIVLQMTPMIDIVFQLLVFFVFTFKIVQPEGDFNIRMPTEIGQTVVSETPVLAVRMRAGENRELAGLALGDVQLEGDDPFGQLQQRIRAIVDDSGGPGTVEQEVELHCDFDLRYKYAIDAMTAITGYVDPATGRQHKLIERVRFAPPQKQ